MSTTRHAIMILILIQVWAAAAPASAQEPPDLFPQDAPSGEKLVPVRFFADADVVHGGQSFHVVAVFDVEPGWHIYWMNAGDAGLPTEVKVTAQGGFEVGTPRFTRPRAFREQTGLAYGYEKQVALFVPVKAPPRLDDGKVELSVTATWLVCKKICLMGSAERRVVVRTSSAPAAESAEPVRPADAKLAKLVDTHRARLPKPLKKLRDARVEFDGSRLVITGPAGDRTRAAFFPAELPGVTFGDARVVVEGGRFTVDVPVEVKPGNALGQPMSVRGLVTLGQKLDEPCYDFDLPLTADGRPR